MKQLYRPFLLTLMLFSVLIACADQEAKLTKKPEFLFVFFDAGETNAMVPVLNKLADAGKSVQVITFGTSSTLKLGDKVKGVGIENGSQLTGAPVNREWDRYQGLPSDKLSAVINQYEPKVLITGMSSVIQQQLIEYYADKSVVASYFDNYGPLDNISYASIVRQIEKHLDLLMVPSTDVASTAKAKRVEVVGQPALEASIASFAAVDKDAVFEKTGLDKQKPVVSFMGGYDPEYEEVLTVFVKGMVAFPEYQTILRPHPKTPGALEKALIEKEQCEHCKVSQTDMTTTEAVAISDVVVCHHSTVGIQAIFLGKKVIYVEVPDATFTNPDLSSWHFSKQVFTPEAFALEMKTQSNNKLSQSELFKLAGIPENSAEKISDILVRLLAQ